ncbi:hypothetical protein HPB48_006399 [Haemaphysalis longicornis]|uniref:DUF7041 domain-containing protein n=1 Tax=Haemaphysalis longicornis TaxID=44386 RepID=A0A9J6FJQ9_HAELO|nr:hypothetical protein HPB48_006399 [Haemaphysalis longicornis]
MKYGPRASSAGLALVAAHKQPKGTRDLIVPRAESVIVKDTGSAPTTPVLTTPKGGDEDKASADGCVDGSEERKEDTGQPFQRTPTPRPQTGQLPQSPDSGVYELDEEYADVVTELSAPEKVRAVELDFEPREDIANHTDAPVVLALTELVVEGKQCPRRMSGKDRERHEQEVILDKLRNEGLVLRPESKASGGLAYVLQVRHLGQFGGPELLIQLRLPTFWRKNPHVWFAQVEAVFDLHRVISETTEFRCLLCNLPPGVADEVADVIRAPYQRLKQSILDRTTASESALLRHLLAHEELGDRRSSQLLNTMRRLVGASDVDSNGVLSKELFLQRLPQSTRIVLAAAGDLTLDRAAELADRVHDVTSLPTS